MTKSMIALSEIHPNPDQPRRTFKKETIRELADSIKQHGLIQPIVVEPDPAGGYMITAGERRYRAHLLLGRKEIAAIVQDRANHSGRERKLTGIIENVQREDMNVIDEGLAYKSLIEEHGMRPSEISIKIGKSVTHVMNFLERLKLPAEIQDMMREGELSADMRLVSALLQIRDRKAAIGLAQRATAAHMTIKGIVRAAKRMKEAIDAEPLNGRGTPSIRLASRRSRIEFSEQKEPPHYNAMVHMGKAPPWKSVAGAAVHTCDNCELRSMANAATCGRCPLVDMLTALVEETK